jgi:YfiH family protein
MSNLDVAEWLTPDWPVSPHVRSIFTTRSGGISQPPWASLNLGDHVGDDAEHVAENRLILRRAIGVDPVFLTQVHGCDVRDVHAHMPDGAIADACWTDQVGVACTIMVADCLPLLITNAQGSWVAAAHAGWRGLAGQGGRGVVETTLARCLNDSQGEGAKPSDVRVWLGPCIGPTAFEVGPEVKAAFCEHDSVADAAFELQRNGRFLANLALLARQRLHRAGVKAIYGNDSSAAWCTHTQSSQFFSHRRDAHLLGSTGRMAAAIWLHNG